MPGFLHGLTARLARAWKNGIEGHGKLLPSFGGKTYSPQRGSNVT